MIRTATAAALCLALIACSGRETDAPSEPAPTDTSTPEAEPTNSIFDAEAGVEPAADALEPRTEIISFAKGGSELDAAATGVLDDLLKSEQITRGGDIIIRGHSDAGGNYAVNERVSRERAEQVRDYLVANGVAEGRLAVIAFGAQNPVEPNANPDGTPNEKGREANRRVEVTVLLPTPTSAPKPAAATGAPAGES